jgi:hypothetical protein
MSYWSENPELYDSIIVEELVRRGLITERDAHYEHPAILVYQFKLRPDFYEICQAAEQAYWGDRVDEGMERSEDGR